MSDCGHPAGHHDGTGIRRSECAAKMRDHTADQPKPTRGIGSEQVFPAVIADLQAREARGISKYGASLNTWNGRSALIDLYQELLDAVLYTKQRLMEEDEGKDFVHTSRALEAKNVNIGSFSSYQGPIFAKPCPPVVEFYATPIEEETVLEEAQRLVGGDRGASYGHPLDDMTRTADMLTALFRHKLQPGSRFIAEDISKMMVCVKLSRETNAPKRDNRVDGPGYFQTLDMQIAERAKRVASGQKEWELRPGEDRAGA